MSKIFTTADLAAYMNTTLVDAVAAQVTNSINSWIETRTGRCFGETKTITERYDWSPIIWLRHIDIDTSATGVSIDLGYPNKTQTTLDSTAYFWNEWGRVTMYLQRIRQFNPSAVNNDLVNITYKYGNTTVPDDLQMAALTVAAGFYNWATNGQKDIVSAQVNSYRLQFSGSVRGVPDPNGGPAPGWEMNREVQAFLVIDSYRMRRL